MCRLVPRITNEYMPPPSMMTLRIEPELLAALKQRAGREGRSVSAEVIRMIRREVTPVPARRQRPKSTAGMFPEFEAPSLEEFKQLRSRFASTLLVGKARK